MTQRQRYKPNERTRLTNVEKKQAVSVSVRESDIRKDAHNLQVHAEHKLPNKSFTNNVNEMKTAHLRWWIQHTTFH